MQVTETASDGLKREFKIHVPASELDQRLTARLEEMKETVRIRGFRPGKVPVAHLRRIVGRQTMSEIVNDMLKEQSDKILADRGERAAIRPTYDLTEDEAEANRILDAKADLEYSLKYEALPQISLGEFKSITVERPVVSVPDEEVETQIRGLARSTATYSPKDGPAAESDQVTIDYVGKLGGEPFEGGSDTGARLVLGSKQFIPGFEDQLLGASAGDERTVTVTFPEDYGAANLAGKEAVFDVKVTEVATPDSIAIDDALAQKLGLSDVEALRAAVRRQIEQQYSSVARQRVKRQLLDQLDVMHVFDLPPTMVDMEFDNVWRQVSTDLQNSGRTFADENTTEEEARELYKTIAARRVRLGLVLGEIGERNKIDVTEQELQRALQNEIRRMPGRENEVAAFYRDNPAAITQLRAPIYEEKVVDFLLELVQVTDRSVTRDELKRLIEEDEENVPGLKTDRSNPALDNQG